MTGKALNKALLAVTLATTCMLAAACATQSAVDVSDSEADTPTSSAIAATAPTHSRRSKAITSYRDYLARYPNSPEYDDISRRLADLLVEQAADLQLETASSPEDAAELQAQSRQSYAAAIGYYEYLLDKDPQAPGSIALLYQLSRAYEESGQSQQALAIIDRLLSQELNTDRQLYADTRFRQGELFFAQKKYLEAGNAYQSVVELGASVSAYEQSLYKLGWSLFKQERYSDALPVLFTFLERKIEPDKAYLAQLQSLGQADREQMGDLLRIISRSFAQTGGVDSVSRYFRLHGKRGYEEQVYLDLADWYVEQEQVSEAANTWLALAQHNPLSARAPRLTARAIELYRQAGFRQRQVELQKRFVLSYGMDSDFWSNHAPADLADVVAVLQSTLQELARLAHNQADKTDEAAQVIDAERWYRDYLAWFGDEPAAPEINLQLAELLYDHGRYLPAWDEYERTAWSRGTHSHAVEAALGAQHASEKVLEFADKRDQKELSERAMTGALRFAASYPEHQASPVLLAHFGTVLLEQHQYARALEGGDQILAIASSSPALRQVAWSLRAQALFAMTDYPGSAMAYNKALQVADKDDERRSALQRGLASATYQLANQALANGDKHRAATLYQQAAQIATDPAIQSMANFDAATTLMIIESWSEAIEILRQFRKDYPDNPLQQEASQKLAYCYERDGAYTKAADEYLAIGQDQDQSQALKREALLRAAELYQQTGATQRAITIRENYLERFPEPAAVAVEVMQQLAQLELDKGDLQRRQHWLHDIIQLDSRVGKASTARPAADAALELAEQQLAAFRRIQLVDPVQENLAQKISAMKNALEAFEAAIDYGIYPITTAATYHIASMYDELGRALLDSERPTSLTAEERLEYDVLLAQQAAPFAQQAIAIYQSNVLHSSNNQHDTWIEKSERRLNELQHDR